MKEILPEWFRENFDVLIYGFLVFLFVILLIFPIIVFTTIMDAETTTVKSLSLDNRDSWQVLYEIADRDRSSIYIYEKRFKDRQSALDFAISIDKDFTKTLED